MYIKTESGWKPLYTPPAEKRTYYRGELVRDKVWWSFPHYQPNPQDIELR